MSEFKEQIPDYEASEALDRFRDSVPCLSQRLELLSKELRSTMDEIIGDVLPDGALQAAEFWRLKHETADMRKRLAVLEFNSEMQRANQS